MLLGLGLHTIPAEIAELAETSSARHTTQRMAGG